MQQPRPFSHRPEEPANLGFSLFQIERFLLGELSPAEYAEITRAAESNPKLAAYIQRAQAWTEQAKSLPFPSLLQTQKNANRQANGEWLTGWKARLQNGLRTWGKPAWGMPGLAMASVILLLGVLTLTRPAWQPKSPQGNVHLSPKGGLAADMSLEYQGKSHISGADLTVRGGDTLRIFYHSSDSLYFQLWNQDGRGDYHPLHAGVGEGVSASPKWKHSGKSLVMESGEDLRQLRMIWAGSKLELAALQARLKAGKKMPEENSATFHIHSPQTK